MKGYILIDSWAGRSKIPVLKMGETPKKIRVQLLQDSVLPGRKRQGKAGDVVLIPKHAFKADA